MKPVNAYFTKNPYATDGRYFAPKGFFLHSVGVGQPDPMVFIRGWDKETYDRAGINGFLSADAVYLTAPCLEQKGRVKRMPHAGVRATNDTYIGFEMCEPAQIKYTSGANFTVSDKSAAQSYVRRTYDNAVELFAQLCALHALNPLQDGVILSHAEGYRRGMASNHADPEHLWRGLDLPYTMDTFRAAVAAKLEEVNEVRYQTLKDVPDYYRPTIDKLLANGTLKGKAGEGESLVLDLGEDAVRVLVILDRAGNFD